MEESCGSSTNDCGAVFPRFPNGQGSIDPLQNRLIFCRTCLTFLAPEHNIIGWEDKPSGHDPDIQLDYMFPGAVVINNPYTTSQDEVREQISCGGCSRLLGYIVVSNPAPDTKDGFVLNARFALLLRNGREVMYVPTRTAVVGDWRHHVTIFAIPVEGNYYQCLCGTHLALERDVIERPPEVLVFRRMFNFYLGPRFEQNHIIADSIHCDVCYTRLGFIFRHIAGPQDQGYQLNTNTMRFVTVNTV